MFKKLIQRLFPPQDTNPQQAYDLWAKGYDNQAGNLMLDLDEIVFSSLLNSIDVLDMTLVDIGCGTGRHWNKILELKPHQLVGYDVSAGMLQMLQKKYPVAITHKINNEMLGNTPDQTADIIISTLTIAHIESLETALAEWDRILKPGGYIIITDYHPAALQKGGKRTFTCQDKNISIKNYIYPIEKLKLIAGQLHWQTLRLEEKVIDESVKHYYEKKNALAVFESFRSIPVIYGILFSKIDATQ